MLDMVFKFDYRLIGLRVLERALRGMDGLYEYFPRATHCQFEVRSEPRNEIHDLHCILPMNLYYEKIFVLIWFWNIFLAMITTGSALVWLFRSLYCPGHASYLREHLRGADSTGGQLEVSEMVKFTQDYARQDVMFMLRLVGNNLGDAVANEVVCGLWNKYSLKRCPVAETEGSGEGELKAGLRAGAGVKIEEV